MMTNPTGRVTQGQFSFLPDLSDEEITLCRDSVEAIGSRRLGVITMGEDGARVIAARCRRRNAARRWR